MERTAGRKPDATPRKLTFRPGYRREFWHRNCVAIGLSAGFIEPLEASALALVELSAAMLSDEMPATRAAMDIVARRFNDFFTYRWERVIDFLKLHYVLSQRDDSPYWHDNRRAETVPDRLRELLRALAAPAAFALRFAPGRGSVPVGQLPVRAVRHGFPARARGVLAGAPTMPIAPTSISAKLRSSRARCSGRCHPIVT